MTSIRVEPDKGPPVSFLPGGSRVTDEERAADVLSVTIQKLRQANRAAPAREISLAITHCQEAAHWLKELGEKRP